VAALFVAGLLLSHTALAQRGGTTYRASTTAGQQVRLHQFARWDGACRSTGDVIFTMVTAPQGGALEQKHEMKLDAGAARVGDTDCAGRPIPAIGLYYTPRPGFIGTDHFSFRVDYGRGAVTDDAVIDVR
jgi:hypothetical protein